jgi:hypothetical protein
MAGFGVTTRSVVSIVTARGSNVRRYSVNSEGKVHGDQFIRWFVKFLCALQMNS